MNKRKSRTIAPLLEALYLAHPDAECALVAKNAFELLCATILSAQCTDIRVNLVTPALFAAYPTAHALAAAELDDVIALVRTTGFFRNKAKNLIGMAQNLVALHGGEVPRTLEELIGLAGVARKTANVVLGVSYKLAVGVVVDTHVARLSFRLGLTKQTRPEAIEKDLMAILPESEWIHFSHLLIFHGRRVCVSRSPRCGACSLYTLCPRKGVTEASAASPPSARPKTRWPDALSRASRAPTPAARKGRPSPLGLSESGRGRARPKQQS